MNEVPLLSVCLITYNHEKYIRQALDGIFMQQITFPMEVIIADDCSIDNTRNIILEYKERYGDVIKLIFQEKNVGAAKNWLDLMHSPKGKYVAYLEGDDYWTDAFKLQKQVDFMEKHPDYSICFHKSRQIDKDGNTLDYNGIISQDEEKTFTREDLAMQNFMPTASVLFKKNFTTLPEWIVHSPAGDYPLHILNARFGLIKYLPETMAVYRVGSGTWSTLSRVNQLVSTLMTVQLIINNVVDDAKVKSLLSDHYNSLLKDLEHFITEQNKLEINKNQIASSLRIRDLLKIIWRKLQ